jgi:hypothetical protein
VNALDRQISLSCPSLPPFLHQVSISRLAVQKAAVGLLIARHEDDVSVHVADHKERLDVIILS